MSAWHTKTIICVFKTNWLVRKRKHSWVLWVRYCFNCIMLYSLPKCSMKIKLLWTATLNFHPLSNAHLHSNESQHSSSREQYEGFPAICGIEQTENSNNAPPLPLCRRFLMNLIRQGRNKCIYPISFDAFPNIILHYFFSFHDMPLLRWWVLMFIF